MNATQSVTLALTGASGMRYAMRLLETLLAQGVAVNLLYSRAAQVVAQQELDFRMPSSPKDLQAVLGRRFAGLTDKLAVYGREQWFAPVASGTGVADAMVVCPCTMGTLAAVAAGMADNLIGRAADVTLKERRKLILVPRETPFSPIHLENMLKLARLGAVILPANPGFYHRPASIEDLVDFVVARILDHLGITHTLLARWGA